MQIANYLQQLPRTERRQLVASVDRQGRQFAAWVQSRKPTDVQDRATNVDYLRQRIPCPFLGAQNECRVYPVRPLICRGHHALESNAGCQTGESTIRTIPGLDQATSQAMSDGREIATALGLTPAGGLISTFAPLFKSALSGGSQRPGR
jgi:Fe-S-cluster containining protein